MAQRLRDLGYIVPLPPQPPSSFTDRELALVGLLERFMHQVDSGFSGYTVPRGFVVYAAASRDMTIPDVVGLLTGSAMSHRTSRDCRGS